MSTVHEKHVEQQTEYPENKITGKTQRSSVGFLPHSVIAWWTQFQSECQFFFFTEIERIFSYCKRNIWKAKNNKYYEVDISAVIKANKPLQIKEVSQIWYNLFSVLDAMSQMLHSWTKINKQTDQIYCSVGIPL